jgi:predicted DNA-binding protein (UPF0251 family)
LARLRRIRIEPKPWRSGGVTAGPPLSRQVSIRRQLPEDQREAIILIGASGFSYEEAAEICGCAVGTIKSRVSRARTRLQEILKISGEDEYGPDAISAQVMGTPGS